MKYFSTFSGIGGFEYGIQCAFNKQLAKIKQDRQGWDRNSDQVESDVLLTSRESPLCVGYSEIDKYAIKVYERNFNGTKNYGDITKINADELPDFDCLVGGFPCQAFSIAGKRKGFNDTRGTLFFDLARILRAKQPRLFVFENVKGLLSHDNGNTFKTIIATIDELGYDCQWQVINSKNHGVPQNRERIFIVGHLRGTPRPKVFPITETDRTTDEGLEPQNTQGEVASTVRSRYGNGTGSHIVQLNNPTHSNDRVYGEDGISPSLNTMQGGNRQPKIVAQRGREDGQVLEPRPDDNTNTLTSVAKDNYLFNGKIRRLTPVECERLQGFPDNWTKYGIGDEPISDSQRYKQCGNAVTTNVIRDVFERIFDSEIHTNHSN
jgi:DNA (cytosine-5)-methyltransferase 1